MGGFGGGATVAAARVVLGVESAQFSEGLRAAEAQYAGAIGSMGGMSAELAERQLRTANATERLAAAMKIYGRDSLQAREATAALINEQRKYVDLQAESYVASTKFGSGMRLNETHARRFGSALGFTTNALIGGAGLVYGIKVAVDAATKFQAEMRLLQTQALSTHREVVVQTKNVLNVAGQLATTPDNLSKGLYRIESAGIRGSHALNILKTAAMGARIGMADLESTTNALVAVQKTGIRGAQNLGQAMGTLDAIVGAGNMRMQDLAQALASGVVPAAKQFGLSLAQLGGALDVLTVQGVPAELAATRLRYTIALLGASTPKAAKQLESIGLSSIQVAKVMRTQGLLPAIELLDQKLKSSGMSIERQNEILVRAYGGGRSSTTILTLLQNLDMLRAKTAEIEKKGSSQQFHMRWLAQVATAQYQFDRLRAEVDRTKIELGNALLPGVVKVTEHLSNWLSSNVNQARLQRDFAQGFKEAEDAAHGFGEALHEIGVIFHEVDALVPGSLLKKLVEGFLLFKAVSVARNFRDGFLTPLKNITTQAKEATVQLAALDRQAASIGAPGAARPLIGPDGVPLLVGGNRISGGAPLQLATRQLATDTAAVDTNTKAFSGNAKGLAADAKARLDDTAATEKQTAAIAEQNRVIQMSPKRADLNTIAARYAGTGSRNTGYYGPGSGIEKRVVRDTQTYVSRLNQNEIALLAAGLLRTDLGGRRPGAAMQEARSQQLQGLDMREAELVALLTARNPGTGDLAASRENAAKYREELNGIRQYRNSLQQQMLFAPIAGSPMGRASGQGAGGRSLAGYRAAGAPYIQLGGKFYRQVGAGWGGHQRLQEVTPEEFYANYGVAPGTLTAAQAGATPPRSEQDWSRLYDQRQADYEAAQRAELAAADAVAAAQTNLAGVKQTAKDLGLRAPRAPKPVDVNALRYRQQRARAASEELYTEMTKREQAAKGRNVKLNTKFAGMSNAEVKQAFQKAQNELDRTGQRISSYESAQYDYRQAYAPYATAQQSVTNAEQDLARRQAEHERAVARTQATQKALEEASNRGVLPPYQPVTEAQRPTPQQLGDKVLEEKAAREAADAAHERAATLAADAKAQESRAKQMRKDATQYRRQLDEAAAKAPVRAELEQQKALVKRQLDFLKNGGSLREFGTQFGGELLPQGLSVGINKMPYLEGVQGQPTTSDLKKFLAGQRTELNKQLKEIGGVQPPTQTQLVTARDKEMDAKVEERTAKARRASANAAAEEAGQLEKEAKLKQIARKDAERLYDTAGRRRAASLEFGRLSQMVAGIPPEELLSQAGIKSPAGLPPELEAAYRRDMGIMGLTGGGFAEGPVLPASGPGGVQTLREAAAAAQQEAQLASESAVKLGDTWKTQATELNSMTDIAQREATALERAGNVVRNVTGQGTTRPTAAPANPQVASALQDRVAGKAMSPYMAARFLTDAEGRPIDFGALKTAQQELQTQLEAWSKQAVALGDEFNVSEKTIANTQMELERVNSQIQMVEERAAAMTGEMPRGAVTPINQVGGVGATGVYAYPLAERGDPFRIARTTTRMERMMERLAVSERMAALRESRVMTAMSGLGGQAGMGAAMGAGMMLTMFGGQVPHIGGLLQGAGAGMMFLPMMSSRFGVASSALIGGSFAAGSMIRHGWHGTGGRLLGDTAQGAMLGAGLGMAVGMPEIGAPVGAAVGLAVGGLKTLFSASDETSKKLLGLAAAAQTAHATVGQAHATLLAGRVNLANDRVQVDQLRAAYEGAKKAVADTTKGTQAHKVAVDNEKAALQNLQAAQREVTAQEKANTRAQYQQNAAADKAKQQNAQLAAGIENVAKGFQHMTVPMGRFGAQAATNAQKVQAFANRMDDLANKAQHTNPKLADTYRRLAQVALETRKLPSTKMINVILNVGVKGVAQAKAVFASLFGGIDSIAKGGKVPLPGVLDTGTVKGWGHGQITFNASLDKWVDASGHVIANQKQAWAEWGARHGYTSQPRGGAHVPGKGGMPQTSKTGGGGGREGYVDPSTSMYLAKLNSQIDQIQAGLIHGNVKKLEQEELAWLRQDYKRARTAAERDAIAQAISQLKSQMAAATRSAISNGGVGLIPQGLQDRYNKAYQSGNKQKQLAALEAEKSYLEKLAARTHGAEHHKAEQLLNVIVGKIDRLTGVAAGTTASLAPLKDQLAVQKAIAAMYKGAHSNVGALERKRDLLLEYLKESGHTRKQRADAEKQLRQTQKQIREAKAHQAGGGYLAVIKALQKEADDLDRIANNRHKSLKVREQALTEENKVRAQIAAYQKKAFGVAGASFLTNPKDMKEWLHLQNAYYKAQQTPSKTDDVKALKAEQAFLQRVRDRLHGKAQEEANKLLASIDTKLQKLINVNLQTQKDLIQTFLSEQASFFASYGSNDFMTGANGQRTAGSTAPKVEVHQHFPPGTEDSHDRHAIYARTAMQTAFDG